MGGLISLPLSLFITRGLAGSREHERVLMAASLNTFLGAAAMGISMSASMPMLLKVFDGDMPAMSRFNARVATAVTLADFFIAPVVGGLSDAFGRVPSLSFAYCVQALLRGTFAQYPTKSVYVSRSLHVVCPQSQLTLSLLYCTGTLCTQPAFSS